MLHRLLAADHRPIILAIVCSCRAACSVDRNARRAWAEGAKRRRAHERTVSWQRYSAVWQRSLAPSWATDDVDFDLEEGAKEAIIGPNGAGKSTFFGLVSGHHRPDRGSVHFDGHDITGRPPHQIARLGISRAFQVSNIFHQAQRARERSLGRAGAQRTRIRPVQHLPRRSDWNAPRRSTASLCRAVRPQSGSSPENSPRATRSDSNWRIALAGKPRLLLLDEPTAGM